MFNCGSWQDPESSEDCTSSYQNSPIKIAEKPAVCPNWFWINLAVNVENPLTTRFSEDPARAISMNVGFLISIHVTWGRSLKEDPGIFPSPDS